MRPTRQGVDVAYTPAQTNLWYINGVIMTSHIERPDGGAYFYLWESWLQEGVIAQVPALLGHVSTDQTRTHVVHDLLEACGGDGGSQDVQDGPTGGSYLVVYLLVLEKGVWVRIMW